MQNLSDWMSTDWILVGSVALVVGTTASFAGGVGGASGALLGSSTGVVLGAAISSNKQRKTEIEIQVLQQQVAKQEEWKKLNHQLTILQTQVTELHTEKVELAKVQGQFVQKQAELQQVEQRLTILNQQKEELERRVAEINHHKPDLPTLEQLQKQIQQFRLDKSGLEGQINALHSQVKILEEKERSLKIVDTELSTKKTQIETELSIKQPQLDAIKQEIQKLQTQSPQLEQLAAEIQQQIRQFGIEKSGLECQINALRPQIEYLEEKERSLNNIETELSIKQTQLDAINQEIQKLQIKSEKLEQRAAELELLRATYDGLFSQQESFEERVNQLRPEIDRLEAEKQRILQAIQENQREYHRIEHLRQQLSDLRFQITDKQSQFSKLEIEIRQLNGSKASLEENNAKLRQEQEKLYDDIRRLRGEIENLENSAEVALRALKEGLWLNLPDTKQSVSNEQIFLQNFTQDIQAQGLNFPQRVIYAFHTSLKVQDISALVILAGISGTGKSELPQKYAKYIGAQLLTLAVQPRWDSPQDLQGFYNYIEKKFKPTDLMRGLYQYNNDARMQDRMVIVLLDEMNLARVEYYFSEFLSKLETRRSHPTYLEIDVGSLPLKDTERRLEIPKQFLFVGTMNEDETTQTLSDKVLDRANVLTFGKPQNLQLRHESHSPNPNTGHSSYLAYSDFRTWIKTPDANSPVVEKVKSYLDRVNQVMETMGHPFAHRVYQAIIQYVVNYPGVEDSNSAAFKFAIADQFGQKILPKLRGVMIDEFTEELDELKRIIADINDQPLIAAFAKAREGRYGQFQWQGLVYQDEAAI